MRLLFACAALTMVGAACAPSAQVVEVLMRHSKFEPAVISVPRGVPVTLVFKNADPIDHEWILGDAAVHERHRSGTEPVHEGRADEIGVPALSERSTTLAFGAPASLAFICHLPGHERYGMVGRLEVR
ncbi:MAG: hypothetical protein FJ028_03095 [Chloroflexi bacterium]|nr:hypothetical protein [Chloroflexota bacterium]